MNLGFIGTGKIASSVITGICKSKIDFKKIIISSRNKKIAKNLKQKFKKVIIAKDNQEIVDKCDWVFLSVTPTVGEKIIKEIKAISKRNNWNLVRWITRDDNIKAKSLYKKLSKKTNWEVYELT